MNLPLELQPLGIEKPEEKKKKNEKLPARTIKFNDTLIEKNSWFLNYVAYGASDCQLLDALFEVEPEQLAAVRNLASNVVKTNKNFVTEYVQKDTEQNRGKRPYKFARQGKAIKKVTIRHPASPTIPTKMTPSMLRRVEILKTFLQKLFSEKARRAAIQSKARFVKALIKGGLDLYKTQKKSEEALENEKGRASSHSTSKSEDVKQRNETGGKEGGERRGGGKKKEKSKEKNRKRAIEGLRDDRKSTKEEFGSDSADEEEEEDEGWYHNSIIPARKKARHAESPTNLAAIKRVKKAKREESENEEDSELSDYSSNNSGGEEESFEDGEDRGD